MVEVEVLVETEVELLVELVEIEVEELVELVEMEVELEVEVVVFPPCPRKRMVE